MDGKIEEKEAHNITKRGATCRNKVKQITQSYNMESTKSPLPFHRHQLKFKPPLTTQILSSLLPLNLKSFLHFQDTNSIYS